ncbi:DUF6802 family protein [Nocardia rhamnosiphila]|uniref:DUF6802 family protein n=1 Tax=Nocardia rhamnosiphila TaxID=426716 RepID=UPI001FDFAF65|nr:DUF6802 family protein [Nocardia rhamnosiphila]
MPTSGEFPGIGMPSFEATSSMDGLGPVEMESPTQDLVVDGILDTFVTTGPDSMSVWTDTDLDGYADRLSVVENDGRLFGLGIPSQSGWDGRVAADRSGKSRGVIGAPEASGRRYSPWGGRQLAGCRGTAVPGAAPDGPHG